MASGSPRRKELLTMAGIDFEVLVPDVNEDLLKGESPERMVRRLAYEKAMAALGRAGPNPRIVIAADTTVVSPAGKILGKPGDREEAIRMVRSLQGRIHRVFTGYAILRGESGRIVRKVQRVVRTAVRIRKMNLAEIIRYVDLGEGVDKAGAYAAQGAGMTLIEGIRGSYTNVVGLPMTEVLADLKGIGWKP